MSAGGVMSLISTLSTLQPHWSVASSNITLNLWPKNEGLPRVENINVLSGSFINLEYRLPNGNVVKFLDDKASYLGSQLEIDGLDRCIGIAANMEFLLICSYEENGQNPELVVYKKR